MDPQQPQSYPQGQQPGQQPAQQGQYPAQYQQAGQGQYPQQGQAQYTAPNNVERVRVAWQTREETDYRVDFWTAFGWSLLTCGVYMYYILYQLMRRNRDHLLRRAEFIEASSGVAWEKAEAQGKAEALRPYFERVAMQTQMMRAITQEFRDPMIWLILCVVLGPALYFAYYFLNQDMVKLQAAEATVAADLSYIYGELGQPVANGPVTQHGPHNIAGRVVATIFSCGIYGLWWLYNMCVEPNEHYDEIQPLEDQMAGAVQRMAGIA